VPHSTRDSDNHAAQHMQPGQQCHTAHATWTIMLHSTCSPDTAVPHSTRDSDNHAAQHMRPGQQCHRAASAAAHLCRVPVLSFQAAATRASH